MSRKSKKRSRKSKQKCLENRKKCFENRTKNASKIEQKMPRKSKELLFVSKIERNLTQRNPIKVLENIYCKIIHYPNPGKIRAK